MQEVDFQSGAWKRLEALLKTRLNELRELNDAQHDERKTTTIRGQIAEVKKILALPTGSARENGRPE